MSNAAGARARTDVTRTLVLGGGFGGIAVATELRRRLGDRHEVVVVDRREHFMMGLRKLWAVAGIGTLEDGRRSRRDLAGDGVQFLQRDILEIDAVRRSVVTDDGPLTGDYLVIALGAEPRPDLVPGFVEHAHNVYEADAVPALAEAVAAFDGGRIAVVIAGVPYRCPPAPFECVMLLDENLRRRGIRDRSRLIVTTLQPILLPNAGADGSAWLAAELTRRDIAFRTGANVQRFDERRVVYRNDELDADIVIAVPPHRPPDVVKRSGLTGDGEWIVVEPATLRTGIVNVFAIGDVTQIMLANALPLPKAGVFAELEGHVVAAAIAADVLGTDPPEPFDGTGYCFLELGADSATLIEGDFFARPEPRISLREPDAAHARAKRTFETERLQSWFGGKGLPHGT